CPPPRRPTRSCTRPPRRSPRSPSAPPRRRPSRRSPRATSRGAPPRPPTRPRSSRCATTSPRRTRSRTARRSTRSRSCSPRRGVTSRPTRSSGPTPTARCAPTRWSTRTPATRPPCGSSSAAGGPPRTASGKELPARLALYGEDSDPPAKVRLYARFGFAPRRFYADLRRDLAAPVPEVPLDGSLRLVPWSPELDEATRLAHNDAFRDHWGSEPRTAEAWTHGRSHHAPQWSFLVVDDAPDVDALLAGAETEDLVDEETAAALRAGEPLVVGYQMASRYDEDFPVRGYSFGYTDILGVRRAYRGRRVAVAALAAGMRAFAADRMQYASLDVDTENPSGAHGLYASLGYEKVSGSRMYSIEI